MSEYKTQPVSRIIKICNAHDREAELSEESYQALNEDMQDELSKLGTISRLKVVKNGEERLGAEVGSICVEFECK